jgi:hypothetical protein
MRIRSCEIHITLLPRLFDHEAGFAFDRHFERAPANSGLRLITELLDK